MIRWWKPALLGALLLAAGVVALTVGVPPIEEIRGWVADAGVAGPVLYAVLYAALSLTPAPASVLSIGGGVLFGIGVGLPVVLAGAITGAVAGFVLARRLGRASVERFQARAGLGAARLGQLDALLRRRGLLAIMGIRMAPVVPFAVLNMACGLTALRTRDYVIGSAVGMAPAAAAFVAVGAYGADPGSLPFLLSVGGLAIVIVIGAVVARRRRSSRPLAISVERQHRRARGLRASGPSRRAGPGATRAARRRGWTSSRSPGRRRPRTW